MMTAIGDLTDYERGVVAALEEGPFVMALTQEELEGVYDAYHRAIRDVRDAIAGLRKEQADWGPRESWPEESEYVVAGRKHHLDVTETLEKQVMVGLEKRLEVLQERDELWGLS